jgi:hypothetical protein
MKAFELVSNSAAPWSNSLPSTQGHVKRKSLGVSLDAGCDQLFGIRTLQLAFD